MGGKGCREGERGRRKGEWVGGAAERESGWEGAAERESGWEGLQRRRVGGRCCREEGLVGGAASLSESCSHTMFDFISDYKSRDSLYRGKWRHKE